MNKTLPNQKRECFLYRSSRDGYYYITYRPLRTEELQHDDTFFDVAYGMFTTKAELQEILEKYHIKKAELFR